MKRFLILGIVLALIGVGLWTLKSNQTIADAQQKTKDQTAAAKPSKNDKQMKNDQKTPVLVELFTSEGCSSCPSADRVLARLAKEQSNNGAEAITLELHVDYWNYLGWKDEFSQKEFSERQSGYADRFKLDSIYTPQMIVDGQTQFVGSSFETANQAISGAAKTTKANVEIVSDGGKLKIKISDAPPHDDSYVWLAIAEDNLRTNVKRGENGGKTLDHTSVTRELKLLGTFAAADKTFETETAPQLNSAWNKANLKFIVFAQGKDSKKVFGVNKLDN